MRCETVPACENTRTRLKVVHCGSEKTKVLDLDSGGVCGRGGETVAGGDRVFIPLVLPLHLLGADAGSLALVQQQLVLRHLHSTGQTGCSILVSYQRLHRHRVAIQETAPQGEKSNRSELELKSDLLKK